MLSNQLTHLVWVCCDHERRGGVDRDKRCIAHALAEEPIGTLHRRVTCPAPNYERRDVDGGQGCR